MLLKGEQLAAHLDKPLAPLYILHGNEPLLVLEAGDAVRAAARKQGYAEREVLVAGQGFRWDTLQSAAGNLSLFGESKLVDLRIPNGKPGRDGGEALQRYARHLDDGVVTLITLPEIDWATRKVGWFTTLVEAGIAVELNAPERERLPDWIAQRLARKLCSACKKEVQIPREALLEEGFPEDKLGTFKIYGPVGCESCNNGYKGRVGIYEVVKNTPALQRIIMEEGNSIDISIQMRKDGFNDLRTSALLKAMQGVTSLEEVNRVTKD